MAQIFKLVFVILLILVSSSSSLAITVEQAYKAIPHRRTPYLAKRTNIELDAAVGLQEMFSYVDKAIIARVQTLKWLQSGGKEGEGLQRYKSRISELTGGLSSLMLSGSAAEAKDLIVQAVMIQQKFFEQAAAKGNTLPGQWHRHTLVQQSSSKLKQAYGVLMKGYSAESKLNKQAFFDHLCALDFI